MDDIVKAKLKYESPDLMYVTGNEIRQIWLELHLGLNTKPPDVICMMSFKRLESCFR